MATAKRTNRRPSPACRGALSILPAVPLLCLLLIVQPSAAQPYGPPDRAAPGDRMIQQYLAEQTSRIHATFARDVASPEAWKKNRPRYQQEYLYMLGLGPLPDKTPLNAATTGTIVGQGYTVEKLYFESRPQLYVTANLYRPAHFESGARLPAVLYVCGHSYQGRDGNKTAFQSHGIWLARHGMICLIVDTLQLGEIAATHHGTYRENRWWWHARGYTPAGVECWNGIRAIDYLQSRADVDPRRIAVTGISGGGAATFWIAAADPRVVAAAPVSGMADLPSYVTNRVINGHCDCMFLYNTFQWPWTRIASLVAPRPLLFVNSDHDSIFPMDANERIINRLERVYSLYGAGDSVDAVVSIGGHAYRKDIRRAVFRFLRTHLQENARSVTDSEVDLVVRSGATTSHYPIAPKSLRVFPDDADVPSDERNTTIDQSFVPVANPTLPRPDKRAAWQRQLRDELARVVFRSFPPRVAVARKVAREGSDLQLETEAGIHIWLRSVDAFPPPDRTRRVVLLVRGQGPLDTAWLADRMEPGDRILVLEPRGTGATRWTRKNPPNYVERAHVLIGQTVDTGRIRDVIAAARFLRATQPAGVPILVAGKGRAAGWAVYAALWETEIDRVWAHSLPQTHRQPDAPQLLNILRVCDMPHIVTMLGEKLPNGDALPPKENFHLFLLAGQSNMAGRGKITDDDRRPIPGVWVLNKDSRWVPAVAPLHFDKPEAGTGLGRAFARVLVARDPSIAIGLVPCAVGGSGISSWQPGGYHAQTKSHPYDDAIRHAKRAMQRGRLKAILWHQGENDSLPDLSPHYDAKLRTLIERFRSDLGISDLPFLAGQMGQFEESPWTGAKKQVDAAHQALPKNVPATAFIPSNGLTHKGDKVHFDRASLQTLGRRYAKAYLDMVAKAGRAGF